MKTYHPAKCACCPADSSGMTLGAEIVDGELKWWVEKRCPAGHYQLTVDSDRLKELHREAVEAERLTNPKSPRIRAVRRRLWMGG